jgi:hypothetical protein
MLGLPKSTEISKQLPKKAIYDRFKPKPDDRRLFDEQISRMSIVAEISPQTVAIKASGDVSAVYVVLVTLKTPDCDKKNIALLSKLIDQRMLFVLQSGDAARLAVYRADKVLMSESKPLAEWKLPMSGLDLEAVWENVIAQIGGVTITDGNTLDEQIAADEQRAKMLRRIEQLEKQARAEKQPRRKWELAAEVRKLKSQMEVKHDG